MKKLCGRVLIVDDEEDLRQLLQDMLIELGLKVDQASDGRTALHKLEETNFDFIITDLSMPGTDSQSYLENLSRLKPKAAKLIVLSGGLVSLLAKEVEQHIDLQVDSYLTKPFSRHDIYRALRP